MRADGRLPAWLPITNSLADAREQGWLSTPDSTPEALSSGARLSTGLWAAGREQAQLHV